MRLRGDGRRFIVRNVDPCERAALCCLRAATLDNGVEVATTRKLRVQSVRQRIVNTTSAS